VGVDSGVKVEYRDLGKKQSTEGLWSKSDVTVHRFLTTVTNTKPHPVLVGVVDIVRVLYARLRLSRLPIVWFSRDHRCVSVTHAPCMTQLPISLISAVTVKPVAPSDEALVSVACECAPASVTRLHLTVV
jgi:hypothetical protein